MPLRKRTTTEDQAPTLAAAVTIPEHPEPAPTIRHTLAEVERELAELHAPMPPPKSPDDLETYIQESARRVARREALAVLLPHLRRQAIESRLAASKGRVAVEERAYGLASTDARTALDVFERARGTLEYHRNIVRQCEFRLNRAIDGMVSAQEDLAAHDHRFPLHVPEEADAA